MKVRTQKDIEKLNYKIKTELGIELENYKDESAIESLLGILVFTEYIITWVFGPFLLCILLYVIGFFYLDLVHVQYVLYAVIGLVLYIVLGLLLGLCFLFSKLKDDISRILNFSLSTLSAVRADLKVVHHNKNIENPLQAYRLLFKGVIHIVTLPILNQIISEKIPLVGFAVRGFFNKTLTLVSNRISLDEGISFVDKISKEDLVNDSQSSVQASPQTGTIVNKVLGLVQWPFKIAIWFFVLLLIFFLWLIH